MYIIYVDYLDNFQYIRYFFKALLRLNIGINNTLIINKSGYFLLGYYLSKYNISKKCRKKYIGIFLVGFIITYFIIILGMFDTKINVNEFYIGKSPFVLMMSIGLYGIVFTSKNYFIKLTKLISQNSLGIYLIHPVVMIILQHNNINFESLPKYYGIVIYFIIVLSISLVIIVIVKNIPFLRNILP